MGLMVKGEWISDEASYDFDREALELESFTNWITVDGAAGPTGEGGFPAASDRYHLYVSPACPFAHRALILRALKGLTGLISVSTVNPIRHPEGWDFSGQWADPINGFEYLKEAHLRSKPDFTGRVTVPVLWDKVEGRIVSDESADIMRMFDDAFVNLTAATVHFRPAALHAEIDELNTFIQENINWGVYKCGFANSQAAYDRSFDSLFAALDEVEARLGRQRYLLGEVLTETDWRLFTTLVRFDAVYFVHFKTNKKRMEEYPNLSNYIRDLYQQPGVADTVDIEHCKLHYYSTHDFLNPRGIVPKGPDLDWSRPHDRDRF